MNIDPMAAQTFSTEERLVADAAGVAELTKLLWNVRPDVISHRLLDKETLAAVIAFQALSLVMHAFLVMAQRTSGEELAADFTRNLIVAWLGDDWSFSFQIFRNRSQAS